MSALTAKERADLEAKAEAATPGPWSSSKDGAGLCDVDAPGSETVAEYVLTKDAAFIAAANPDTVKRLLADLREAEARATALETRRDELLDALARLSREAPYPSEAEGWPAQRAALLAEVGTLRARVAELERERDSARRSA